jgi:hypothetical protein
MRISYRCLWHKDENPASLSGMVHSMRGKFPSGDAQGIHLDKPAGYRLFTLAKNTGERDYYPSQMSGEIPRPRVELASATSVWIPVNCTLVRKKILGICLTLLILFLVIQPLIPAAGADSATNGSVVSDSFTTDADAIDLMSAAASTPSYTRLSPIAGPVAGGTAVTIYGSNFPNGVYTVTFGGVAATGVSRSNTGTIYATTPGHASGAVWVNITSPPTVYLNEPVAYTYLGVTPTSGPAAGGTVVTITGAGFTGATAVKFGSTSAAFTVVSDSVITATTPAHAIGTVDIVITVPGGTLTDTGAFTYKAPVITSISPTKGPKQGGTVVTITGSGFTGVTAVKFGQTAATSYTFNSDTSITATSPSATNLGTVDITVTTPGGTSATSSADQFTYTPPAITSISPTTGSTLGGTTVTIAGSLFTGVTSVKFGSTSAASYIFKNDTSITAISPAGTGIVDVTVTTPGGTSATSSADRFTYVAPPVPVITAISPTNGTKAGGTSIAITGTGFTGVTSVKFGSTSVSYTFNNDTSITVIAPAGTGTVDITVTTPGGTSATSSADKFTYLPPVVTSISPTSGSVSGGTVVTITGSLLTGATTVYFGTLSATFTVNSDTSITATAPAAPTNYGTIDVTVVTPGGTSATSSSTKFTYSPLPLPTFTSITPTYGPVAGGTTVTIIGTGFTGATSVLIGGTAATGLTVINATAISATTPSGTAGAAWVNVTTPAGTVSTQRAFTYVPAPTFASITPPSGPAAGGTLVTIIGTGFTGATSVLIGGTAATGLTFVSDSQVIATTPHGTAGTTVWVDVVTPNGTAASAAPAYTYVGPAYSSITPSSGPPKGGTVVTISGSGLTGATSVLIGSTAATSLTVVNDAQIIATTPPGTAGAVVNVVISTPNGTATGTNAFTYLTPSVAITLTESTIPLTLQPGHTTTDSGLGITVSANVPFSVTVADNTATLGRTSNYGYMGNYSTGTNQYVSPYTKTLQSPLGLTGTSSGTTVAQIISGPITSGSPLYSGNTSVTSQLLSPNTFTQTVAVTDPVLPTGSTYRIDLMFTITAT